MLHVIYGTDSHKTRKKLHQFLKSDGEVFKLTSENWSEARFDELLVSRGLFESEYTVVLDHLFEKKDIREYVLERLKNIADSGQPFFLLEGKLDIAAAKKIEKFAKKIEKLDSPEAKPSLNIFAITDDLARRDKKRLWISYLGLLSRGISAEEIHGILFWQIKNMMLSKKTADTGLSPFVYQKSLIGSKKFSGEELVKMSSQFVDMTHRVRRGFGDLDIMLEKWILEMK